MRKRVSFYHSLYFKLGALFFILMAFIGLLELRLGARAYRSFIAEINQSLEWDIAAHLANILQPGLLESVDRDRFAELVYPYSLVNPKLEFYLLDTQGRVYSSLSSREDLEPRQVPLESIKRALGDTSPPLPLFGPDPRAEANRANFLGYTSDRRVFSVAPIQFNNESGYLYILIEGQRFSRKIRKIGEFFLARIFSNAWVIGLFGSLLMGFLFFRFLTKRFRHIADVVSEYEQGHYERSLSVDSKDEIGMLSRTLNETTQKLINAKRDIELRDKTRRELIAMITHDLRTPLTAVKGYLDLAREHSVLGEEPELQHDIDSALESLGLQSKLLGDLFELSKLEAQERPPSIDAFRLNVIVKSALSRIHPKAERKSITITYASSGEPACVLVDEVLISRVFDNLLENALRFTPKGGAISLTARFEEVRVLIAISDSGDGVSLAKADVLTEIFAQADVEQNRSHGGAGLGLAIVQRILQMHASTLQIARDGAVGTVFFFELPLEE